MGKRMSERVVKVVERVLRRAPAWARSDLQATDQIVRTRAEEALAAMIDAALKENLPQVAKTVGVAE